MTPIPTIDLRGGHQDDGSRLNTDYGKRMRDSEHSRGICTMPQPQPHQHQKPPSSPQQELG